MHNDYNSSRVRQDPSSSSVWTVQSLTGGDAIVAERLFQPPRPWRPTVGLPGIIGAWICALAVTLASGLARAQIIEYRAISTNGTVMYDGPSERARKLFVASANYPVEIIQREGAWVRVRDFAGDLVWVEAKALTDKRTVIVLPATIDVRQKPDDGAAVSFQARQGVVFDFVDAGTPGWLRVRHRDGATGFVRLREVWGH